MLLRSGGVDTELVGPDPGLRCKFSLQSSEVNDLLTLQAGCSVSDVCSGFRGGPTVWSYGE